MPFTEEAYENAIIELLKNLGYTHNHNKDIECDTTEPLYLAQLLPALKKINTGASEQAITTAIKELQEIPSGSIIDKNKIFTNYIQNGISVKYFDGTEDKNEIIYLIDYENIENNTFQVINQYKITENSTRKPDIVVLVNGLPLVIFELKSPSREQTDASEGYTQLRNYMHEIPSLFTYNAFLVMSDMTTSKAGTITATEDRYMQWKTTDGSYENTAHASFDTFVTGMFERGRFLDIIKNFLLFSGDAKILGAYHQYFAVRKAVRSTAEATKTDGKGGVFWHTQGSGKSLSMVFYAKLLRDEVLQLGCTGEQQRNVATSPTIVVITDRNDLDEQLFSQFVKCSVFLRQQPERAITREHLKQLLDGRQTNGIIFTTAQKFAETSEALSDRKNIIVISDEAHRSNFVDERVSEKGRIQKSFGLIIRESLPNATYIGFTGTPISSKDRSTTEVFGNYIDIYDMTQAVEDNATKPVYYESCVINLKLDENTLRLIDEKYDDLATQTEEHNIEKSKKELGKLEAILGHEETINTLCEDIISHYEENRENLLTGKAMIVAYNRSIAMDIYHTMLSIRPDWGEKLGVVMTESNKDPEEWRSIIGNKRRRDELANIFKDENSNMKIAIVVDMWLTGFDVPSLSTMYVYKPMKDHNLMQAIARVNRVYKEKEGGLVVDYVGIAQALKNAMHDYTGRDKDRFGSPDIAKTAYPKFVEKLEVCRDIFHGFDYKIFMTTDSDLTRATTITGGVNFLASVENEDKKDSYIKEAMLMRQAMSLCRSMLTPKQRLEAAYFDAVRTLLTRITGTTKPLSLKEINAQINELIKQSIQSAGVINLFSDIDIEFNLFDATFLEEVSKMKEKNIAIEILKKLLAEQVKLYQRTNLVKSEKFSERMQKAMNAYLNGLLSNEQVIAELMKMAKEMNEANTQANELGLTEEELAFYDALTKPQAIKDLVDNADLLALTKELTEELRKSRTVDWSKKESARAGMRRLVKKLLKKYKYPPEGVGVAIDTVICQVELWVDNS